MSDSDDDSDYAPDPDDIDEEDSPSTIKLTGLTHGRKRKVDAHWDEMQQEDKKYIASIYSKSIRPPVPITETQKKKDLEMLMKIFGKSQAIGILRSLNSTIDASIDKNDLREQLKDSVKKVQKKTKIVEVQKFAGKEITVEKTVMSSAYSTHPLPTTTSSTPLGTSSSLENMLDTLKGPKVVSTLSKSSLDWDNFKEKEGLEDDLANAGKDGYLTKKEFLERCDYRAFEKERDERLKKAAALQSSSPSSSSI